MYGIVAVAESYNSATCQPGTLAARFQDDALRRWNFNRWLVGLKPASISATNHAKAQECALMMAVNLNTASPSYKAEYANRDPHTQHDGWRCATSGAKEGAQLSNIYAGQSSANLGFLWQTTPAHIHSGFVVDTSSSKQGHRQNVLCPNLDDIGIGHVCFEEASTQRSFCGGCQWAYGRNSNPLPAAINGNPSGFVAWPPHGAVPTELFPSWDLVYWSFATLASPAGIFDSWSIKINGVNAVSASKVDVLCNGSGMPGYSASTPLTWFRFKNAQQSYVVGQSYLVQVTGTGAGTTRTWQYTFKPTNCAALPPTPPTPPPTPPTATCGNLIVEPGEQCDDLLGCCDPSTCQYKPYQSVCRDAAGPCDIAEVCNGYSSQCNLFFSVVDCDVFDIHFSTCPQVLRMQCNLDLINVEAVPALATSQSIALARRPPVRQTHFKRMALFVVQQLHLVITLKLARKCL
jgi:hypothetical protein